MPSGIYKRKPFTEKHLKQLRKISPFKKGMIPWNKNKKIPQLSGKNHWRWGGGKRKTRNGYILIHQPNHPFTDCRGYVPEHRLIIEKIIGRYLDRKKEVVHHINGVKGDNRLKNLLLLTDKQHRRTEKITKFCCPKCKFKWRRRH